MSKSLRTSPQRTLKPLKVGTKSGPVTTSRSIRAEILRKLFHLMELPMLLIYSFIRFLWAEKVAGLILTAFFLILMEVEYLRLELKPKFPDPFNVFRPREKDNVTGAIFFVAATIIVFGVFDYIIAFTALLLTVFGDLASAMIGIKFGKHKIFRKKSLEGFLAGLAINILVGALILPMYPAIYITMAFVASTVELLTGKLDDNLTVPLFAAFTGQLIAYEMQVNLSSAIGPLDILFKSLIH
jgi:dolichol kinase